MFSKKQKEVLCKICHLVRQNPEMKKSYDRWKAGNPPKKTFLESYVGRTRILFMRKLNDSSRWHVFRFLLTYPYLQNLFGS